MISDIFKMFGLVMKSLFKKSVCEMYPFKKPTYYERTRGHIAIDAPNCILCSLCEKRCPTGALKVDKDGRKWAIDNFKCIYCNRCVDCCPKKCLMMDNQYNAPSTTKTIETVDIP